MAVIRLVLLTLLGAGCVAQYAFACDLQASTKHSEAARYIESVQRCLTSLPAEFDKDRAMEQENIRRVNDARIRNGLPPLERRADLETAARWHSLDMAANDFFNHQGKDKRKHGARISLLDRSLIFDVARENIAMMRGEFESGSEGELLHDLLLESEGHYENIMAEDISHIAVGVIRTENGVWLTQLFVHEAGELTAPAPTRLTPGEILSFSARLAELDFTGFQAEQGDRLKRFDTFASTGRSIVPAEMSGDIRIGVRGDHPPTSANERGYYVNLFGPSVTLVPTKTHSPITINSSGSAG